MLSVILLNYNQPDMTIDCIEYLLKNKNYCKDFEIIVIDNGSKDNSVVKLAEISSKHNLLFIDNKENLGFAEGNNVGIREARGEWVLLLNNDTVFKEEFISKMAKAAIDNPDAAAIGPKIYYYDSPSKIWYNGGKITKYYNFVDDQSVDNEDYKQVEWITGCALMVNKKAFEKIGLLDKDFFMYNEDVDWCIRARRAGLNLVYTPYAEIWHIGSKTANESFKKSFQIYYGYRNKLFIVNKNTKGFEYIYLIFVILSGICFRIIDSIAKGNFDSAKGYWFAMIDGLMYKPKNRFLR
ncbi:glycosyltransferase [Methanosarcina sp. DH2]|uniref:glycosyltransferase family 2 protein n=1 Tax=Methanosarcina sp. DH2 TaxID=2605639 RepID=UPI001E596956|nr:glycosyltransferase family 2 protein [Methanosarcina sp. DH2]MCC4770983.1 glycosyltransferase [Methanosarcina sp. DH2]